MNFVRSFKSCFIFAAFLALSVVNVWAENNIMEMPDIEYFDSYAKNSAYAPKVVCCKKTPKFNDKASALKLNVVATDSTFPRFDKNIVIPYVGRGRGHLNDLWFYLLTRNDRNLEDNLNIDGKLYSVSEILNHVNDARSNIMLALQGNMRENKDSLLLDLPGVKKTMDSLNKVNGTLWGKDFYRFYSAINFDMRIGADSSFAIDILKGDSGQSNIVAELQGISFKLNTDSVHLDLGPLKKDSPLDAVVSFDFTFEKEASVASLRTNFKSFVLDMPGLTAEDTKGWPTRIKKGNYRISITSEGAKDNLKLIDEIDQVYFSLKGYWGALDEAEIPLLEKSGFSYRGSKYSIKEIVENLDDYLHIVQYGVDNAIGEDCKINLSDMKKVMDSIFVKRIPLDGVAILNRALQDVRKDYDERDFVKLYGDSLQAVTGSVPLHEGANYIVLKIWPPQFEYDSKLDLNMVNTRDFKAEVAVYVKILIYVSKKSLTLVYDSLILDKVDLAMPNHVYSMDAGMFNVKFGDGHEESYGKLRYNVSINSKNADSVFRANPSMIVDFDSLTFMLDHSIVTPLKNKGGKGKFSYDFDRDEWIMPTPLKRFTSFSGEDLLAHVYAIGNSLRDLRNYVDGFRNTDTSAVEKKKVSDAVENFDWIVFGGSPKQNDSRLVENTKGTFKKHFSNLLDFSGHFNKSWKDVFKGNNKIKVCEVDFLDEKKKSIPVVNRLFKGKIAYVKITFRLDLGLRPDFAQEWERILRKRVAELPTSGHVSRGKDGIMTYEFIIDMRK